MVVKAIGNDLVEVARIARALERYGERMKSRLFTEEEQRYCDSRRTPSVHYSGRFAAKEAVMKVLATGFVEGVGLERGASFRDIEIRRAPSGKPEVRLHGEMATLARRAGVEELLITITHTREQAQAFALGQGTP
jgi:holo-[acyl-carrier protein] synthase